MSVKSFKNMLLADLLKYAKPIDKSTNLQIIAQIYFIENSITLINDHLTHQDEDLALQLMDCIDSFKGLEDEKFHEISDAAFAQDLEISYNVAINLDGAKKKAMQRLDMVKL